MGIDKLIFVCIAALALSVGGFIYMKPQKAFEIQKEFYRCINWNIEPISWEKEMRNTKVMGLILIVVVIVSSFYQAVH